MWWVQIWVQTKSHMESFIKSSKNDSNQIPILEKEGFDSNHRVPNRDSDSALISLVGKGKIAATRWAALFGGRYLNFWHFWPLPPCRHFGPIYRGRKNGLQPKKDRGRSKPFFRALYIPRCLEPGSKITQPPLLHQNLGNPLPPFSSDVICEWPLV